MSPSISTDAPVPGATRSTETARFRVPSLREERYRRDLENVLVSVIGVARIVVEPGSSALTVEYDPDYASEETLRQVIARSGYPLEQS